MKRPATTLARKMFSSVRIKNSGKVAFRLNALIHYSQNLKLKLKKGTLKIDFTRHTCKILDIFKPRINFKQVLNSFKKEMFS